MFDHDRLEKSVNILYNKFSKGTVLLKNFRLPLSKDDNYKNRVCNLVAYVPMFVCISVRLYVGVREAMNLKI